MTAKLSVNLNAVAMLRNRRDLPWPSVERMGRQALQAGAHGLTVHPRPDERHTRATDLPVIRALIDDEYPKAEFNIEGYPTDAFIEQALANQPEQITLVPDDPTQATSDHGWDFVGKGNYLRDIVSRIKDEGARVSLFCDPDADEAQIEMAAKTGADRVELYTGPYGATYEDNEAAIEQAYILAKTAKLASDYKLDVNAGHDLTVQNLPLIAKMIPNLAEVSIGHGLTAEALEFGYAGAVKRFLEALKA